ncbi:UDP-glucose 4-epimerase GalE [Sphingomonas sp. 1P06PA]|uniref:UDP-glucose 4-epimerase GalE n=1 Tax=Sphingomonas sp. 1P06PA TaxID=554121 RepID=UPI0039A5AC96
MTDSSPARPPVLVTGGAGYIGSHAVLALLDAGWDVTVLDNLVTGFRWAVDPRAAFVEGAVEDIDRVTALIAERGIGAIIHFAGSVVVPESVSDPLKYYRNNTAASRSLIEAAVAGGVRHFIFSSTAATYGIPDAVPVAEEAPKRPINPYGMSKLMTETMLADVAAAHPINYCALRYFNVAGADPQGRSGQSTAGATHLIKIAAEAATGKRGHVSVFGTDYATADGTGVRDYIHVSDLADAHVHALEALIASPRESLTLNCGYGRGYSVLEVLDAVDRATNAMIVRRMEPRRAGDPDALVADNRAILARLPWRPRHADLDRIVADALAWERALSDRA